MASSFKGPPPKDDEDEDFKQAKIRAMKGRAMPKGVKSNSRYGLFPAPSKGRYGSVPSNKEGSRYGSVPVPPGLTPRGMKQPDRPMPKGIKGGPPKVKGQSQEDEIVNDRKKVTY